MFLSTLVDPSNVAEAARRLGAPFSSLTQWVAADAILVDYQVYTKVKRTNGMPSKIPDNWVWFNETWYRPSCGKPLLVKGSHLPTVAESLAARRNTRTPVTPIVLSGAQTEELRKLAELGGFETMSDAMDALLGIAKPV